MGTSHHNFRIGVTTADEVHDLTDRPGVEVVRSRDRDRPRRLVEELCEQILVVIEEVDHLGVQAAAAQEARQVTGAEVGYLGDVVGGRLARRELQGVVEERGVFHAPAVEGDRVGEEVPVGAREILVDGRLLNELGDGDVVVPYYHAVEMSAHSNLLP